jgi:hypothetical protein
VDIGLKLKEVQMTPGSFDSIMHIAVWFAAFRTSEFTAGSKINVDIQLLFFSIEIYLRDVPRIF